MRIEPVRRLTKIYDFAAAVPLIVLYLVWIASFFSSLISEVHRLSDAFTAVTALSIVYEIATILFLSLVVSLFVFRRLPENHAKGVLPRLAAMIGANIQLLFLAVPQVDNSPAVLAASTAVTVAGLAGSIYFASVLGGSFSVLPQARGLVTHGPYRFVRHPLYVAEQIAVFGVMWQYQQPWAFLIFAASVSAQFARMHYEEKVLAETYPAYRAYMARTGRIIPRGLANAWTIRASGQSSVAIEPSSTPLVK
jgi:protein-S-isoprenylcysteine O-methyltransferase Ste14